MQQHDLKQGSPAWLAHRQTTHNASDAPAMMGCSPYEQRGALIRRLATGISPDVDAGTQKLFDDGHRFEALARPGAETIVGDDLSPLSGSIDAGLSRPLAASFDGLTFMRDTNWEHKSLNEALRAILPAHGVGDHSVGARLPLHNRVQLEQQMLVSGADQSLFTASKWNGDTLVEARHCWYASDPELRAQIVPGWAQLEKDVAAYAPTEAPEPAKAEALDHLPAVSVRLDGALSVAGNLPTFAQALKAFISKIPTKPATDNEFATVDAACKALKKAEETLDAAEAGALASITDVEAMRRAVAECRKLARDTRLAAEKLVERRKVEVKEQAVIAARRALDDHVAALNAELAPMRLQAVTADFAASIKGLRSIASMQDALDTTLANGKIAADTQARAIRANVATFKAQAAGLEFLFADLGQIVHKAADDFATLVTARVEKHKADEARREEEQRERIRAEEAARLEREAQAKAAEAARIEREAADQKAREEAAAQAKRDAEATRIASESAKASAPGFKVRKPLPDGVTAGASVNDSGQWYAADGTFMNPDGTRSIFDDVDEDSEIEFASQAAQNTPAQSVQPVLKAEASTPDATDRDATASTSPSVGSMGAGQAADAAPSVAPAPQVRAFVAPAAAPSMRLGEIQAAIAPLSITAEGLAQLGFPAHVERGLKLYQRLSLPLICKAMREHLLTVANQQKAA